MKPYSQKLSVHDVERLLANPSPQNKIETVSRIVAELPHFRQDPHELALARDIIERLAGDVEVAVRQAISWQISQSPLLSDKTAKKLASDVASVAFPILRYAQLPDESLLQALESKDARKAMAIAGREGVSSRVSEALIASQNVKAIILLMENKSASIGEASMVQVMEKYSIIPAVTSAIAKRPNLGPEIVLKLISQVTIGIRDYLIEAYGIDSQTVQGILAEARETALVVTLHPLADKVENLEPFLRQLDDVNELTAGFLFRALCAGEIQMFRLGLAIKGELPLLAVDELLSDRGLLGLPALMRRCDIALSLLPAFKAAVVVWRDLEYQGQSEQRATYQAKILAAVFETCMQIEDGDIDELLQHVFTPSTSKTRLSLQA